MADPEFIGIRGKVVSKGARLRKLACKWMTESVEKLVLSF